MSSGLKAGLEKRASHLKVQLAADELKREEDSHSAHVEHVVHGGGSECTLEGP